jgi:hypothetical protein
VAAQNNPAAKENGTMKTKWNRENINEEHRAFCHARGSCATPCGLSVGGGVARLDDNRSSRLCAVGGKRSFDTMTVNCYRQRHSTRHRFDPTDPTTSRTWCSR